MKHYIDILLKPTIEISPYFLLEKVYTQLHLAFVETKDENELQPVGISFPRYGYSTDEKQSAHCALGDIIRLTANKEEDLIKLEINKRLNRFIDYLEIKPINSGEFAIKLFIYKRKRPNLTRSKQRRHFLYHAKRDGLSDQEIADQLLKVELLWEQNIRKESFNLPFIQLKSLSTNNRFRLHIEKTEVKNSENQNSGLFNVYGLSANEQLTAIPEF
jgi:CRISPR-associated endonuclease Csy4